MGLPELLKGCADKTAVLAGCGGGCDVYGCMLLAHLLRQHRVKTLVYVSLSFTSKGRLASSDRTKVKPLFSPAASEEEKAIKDNAIAWKVMPGVAVASTDYFPEALMASYTGLPVYTIAKSNTVGATKEAYTAIFIAEGLLAGDSDGSADDTAESVAADPDGGDGGGVANSDSHNSIRGGPDYFFLMDGGSDVLMTGTETGLATPVEDMMHLKAVHSLTFIPHRYVLALGVTVDVAHGIVLRELSARLKQLQKDGHLVFAQPFNISPEFVQKLKKQKKELDPSETGALAKLTLEEKCVSAAKFFANGVAQCNPVNTIVQSLVVAAMEGHRGTFTPPHLVPRIRKSKIDLTEETATLFCYPLDAIADSVQYLDMLNDGTDVMDMVALLGVYRRSIGKH